MRLLFVTNFYPPYHRGGYEEWCQEVAQALRARGHEITVLTSRYQHTAAGEREPDWLRRDLHLEMEFSNLRNGITFFTRRKKREQENLQQLRELIEQLSPESIVFWGMWNLHRSLAALAETLLPDRVVYYLGDYWPTLPSQHLFYWQEPARSHLSVFPKALLRPIANHILSRTEQPRLTFPHALFCSSYLRDELQRRGITFQNTVVVYGAIDAQLYSQQNGLHETTHESSKKQFNLLCGGRLEKHKGIHTAIEALDRLVHGEDTRHVRLHVVGSGPPDYVAHLREMVQQNRLQPYVHFLGRQPKVKMVELYRQADAFLFTSTWEEPFGRVLVEAMASGTAVIGTCSGGAAEILEESVNALTFPAGDAGALAGQIKRLIVSTDLRQQLAHKGRRLAVEKFDITRMSAEIEDYLMATVS